MTTVADPKILKPLPDDLSTWLAEQPPRLALAKLGVPKLERCGEQVANELQEHITELVADAGDTLDNVVDEVSNSARAYSKRWTTGSDGSRPCNGKGRSWSVKHFVGANKGAAPG